MNNPAEFAPRTAQTPLGPARTTPSPIRSTTERREECPAVSIRGLSGEDERGQKVRPTSVAAKTQTWRCLQREWSSTRFFSVPPACMPERWLFVRVARK